MLVGPAFAGEVSNTELWGREDCVFTTAYTREAMQLPRRKTEKTVENTSSIGRTRRRLATTRGDVQWQKQGRCRYRGFSRQLLFGWGCLNSRICPERGGYVLVSNAVGECNLAHSIPTAPICR
jgi:hypothetical protein